MAGCFLSAYSYVLDSVSFFVLVIEYDLAFTLPNEGECKADSKFLDAKYSDADRKIFRNKAQPNLRGPYAP